MNSQCLLIAFFLCLAPHVALAQEERGPTLWQWTDKASHHDSIVRVSLDGATGTGIVVSKYYDQPSGSGYLGQVMTASHVVADDRDRNAVRVVYRNGKVSKDCQVAFQDEELDIAILKVWVPHNIPAARIADQRIQPGDTLEITGLGGGSELKCCLRHFHAMAADPTNKAQIYANVSLLPGDSGGAVFNKDGALVGIISGGWFWWHDRRVTESTKADTRATWPARASNLNGLKVLLAKSTATKKQSDSNEQAASEDIQLDLVVKQVLEKTR